MKSKDAIPAFTEQAQLKRRLRRHLAHLGFAKSNTGDLALPGKGKEIIRTLHQGQRRERFLQQKAFIADRLPNLLRHFASGEDVQPARVRPSLDRVYSHTWRADLFRLASLTWSVPVSNGYGRRLRYLIWDENNGKLIGILAIGDPVFNLGVRDNLIGWDVTRRATALVNVMDAYVLGALPPYNLLLGGKLLACLLRTCELYDDFKAAYGKSKGIISGQEKEARLLAITTSSSMGRSSIYNRLKLDGVEYLQPIGYTSGWGHFHVPDSLFSDLRDFLREIEHPYADRHRFGQGPNWRLRTTRTALKALGFNKEILRHGIQREVFWCELAVNARSLLAGGDGAADLSTLRCAEHVSRLAVDRWIVPRAIRCPDFRTWQAEKIAGLFTPERMAARQGVAAK